jgi:hypothetical protein
LYVDDAAVASFTNGKSPQDWRSSSAFVSLLRGKLETSFGRTMPSWVGGAASSVSEVLELLYLDLFPQISNPILLDMDIVSEHSKEHSSRRDNCLVIAFDRAPYWLHFQSSACLIMAVSVVKGHFKT